MNKRFVVALIIVMSCSLGVAFAQPGDPGGDPDVPITGIEILIGAGGALGLKKAWENRKKKNK
jgi:hypothetical protein